jgi:hypothetical protein
VCRSGQPPPRVAAMARIRDVVLDCRHPASLARFWAAILDGYAIAPYDEAELERLRGLGVYDTEEDPNVLVEPGTAGRPRLFLQRVPEPRMAKNRTHLDLSCDDLDAEVGRAVGLGASVVNRYDGWITMADPEGNEFCFSSAG